MGKCFEDKHDVCLGKKASIDERKHAYAVCKPDGYPSIMLKSSKIGVKTNELVRLLEFRPTNVPLQINEYGKIVICADIAASLLGIPFDKEQALKLSALRKSNYGNSKRMFEKLLDLNKLVGCESPAVCCYGGIYGMRYANKNFQTKLLPFSNLRPVQWQQLEQRWEKFLTKHYNDAMDKKLNSQNPEIQGDVSTDLVGMQKNNIDMKERTEVEDYDKWKDRMLTMARSQLKEQKSDNETMDKSNDFDELDFTEVDNMILGH
ncbi:Origin recognition complex subunit 6 [Eumeta japonica]|uniref:Origin recognition complex subunit 6 n=1 Tax=Eumeta variegata TaxID=151549 RepID=A0A4C1SJL4_EUMVA|nr:Origin recognition complex subunit 6 [Eumeta japonica]